MKNQKKKIALTLGLSLGIVACAGGNDSAASLTVSDFDIEPTVLHGEIAGSYIVESYAFFNDRGIKISSDLSDCYREKYTDYLFVPDVDGYFVLDAPLVDVSGCISLDDTVEPDLIKGERSISYYYRVKAIDSTGNIIDLNEVNALDLDHVLEEAQSKEILFKAITSHLYISEGPFGDYEQDFKEKILRSSNSDSSVGCVDNLGFIDGCVDRGLVVGDFKIEGEIMSLLAELFIFESHNLQTSNQQAFPTEGSVNFTINNWDGVIEFDAAVAPSYTATNGDETISGDFPDAF
ncbi:MAG: hypothetical protein COA99_05390 [Moraxellaceae bacterium]|nr:MAG: hypothetical protein COA99_05390 [Moraxellaceae bacterium]